MLQTLGFIFSKTVVYTVMVWYVLHASVYAVWSVEEYQSHSRTY